MAKSFASRVVTSDVLTMAGRVVTVIASGDTGVLDLIGDAGAPVNLISDVAQVVVGSDDCVAVFNASHEILVHAQTGNISLTTTGQTVVVLGEMSQSGGDFTVDGGHDVAIGDSTSPTVSIAGQDVSVEAHGAGNELLLSGVGAAVNVSTDGESLSLTTPGQSLSLVDTGNTVVDNAAGNWIVTASQIVETGTNNIFLNGQTTMSQTQLGFANVVTLSPAAPSYTTLSPTEVPGLNASSRLDIFPDAGGTVVNSLFMHAPNPDGRALLIQNTGTSPGQTLTLSNQSVTGTVGDRFFGPGDFIVPAGGGVLITYDDTSPGFWFVRAIPGGGSSAAAPWYDTILTPPAFGFGPNDNVPIAMGQSTLILYTVDSGTRTMSGMVNSNPGGNVEGMVVTWMNFDAVINNGLIFVGDSPLSTVSNRFLNAGGFNADGETGGAVTYIYVGSGSSGRWRELNCTTVT